MVTIKFPTQRNREFPNAYQGIFFEEQGIYTRLLGKCMGTEANLIRSSIRAHIRSHSSRSAGAPMELVLAPFAVIDRGVAAGEVLKVGGQIGHRKQIFDIANRSVELEGYICNREILFNAGY
jgi:hypothetical protein